MCHVITGIQLKFSLIEILNYKYTYDSKYVFKSQPWMAYRVCKYIWVQCNQLGTKIVICLRNDINEGKMFIKIFI